MQSLPVNIDDRTEKGYVVKQLDGDNIGDLAILHYAVYGSNVPVDYFSRKYDTAYTGVSNLGYIAYNRDQVPVAFYGVIPCYIWYEGSVFLAAQSADTMTHPQFRYKGMFVELSRMTFDLCRASRVKFLFGFPNQHSYHGAVKKLGWEQLETMVYFTIPVQTIPVQRIMSKRRWTRKLFSSYTEWIVRKYDRPMRGVPNSVIVDGYAGVYRCEEYLDYKTYSPTRVIQIGEVRCWVNTRNGLLIGDIENLSAENFETTLHLLKKMAAWLGTRSIQFHCSHGTHLYQLFSHYFKASPSYPVLYHDYGVDGDVAKIKFCFADIDIF